MTAPTSLPDFAFDFTEINEKTAPILAETSLEGSTALVLASAWTGSLTKATILGAKTPTGKYMQLYIAAGGFTDSTHIVITTRPLKQDSDDINTADTANDFSLSAGTKIYPVVSNYHLKYLAQAILGTISNGSLLFTIGTNTDSTVTINHAQSGSTVGWLRNNISTGKAQFSNDGTTWVNFDNAGVGVLVAGDGIEISGAGSDVLSVDLADGSGLEFIGGKLSTVFAAAGDGSDGDVVISSNTSLTRDMYYENLTVDVGFTLDASGYRVFVQETLTNNGTISSNGVAGGAGGNGGTGGASAQGGQGGQGGTAGAAGTAGTAVSTGSLYGSIAGKAGVIGAVGANGLSSAGTPAGLTGVNGLDGEGQTVSLSAVDGADGAIGTTGGNGGSGGTGGVGGTAGTGGVATASSVRALDATTAIQQIETGDTISLLRTAADSAGSASGGSGGAGVWGSNGTFTGGGGGGSAGSGGSGSGGGTVLIVAKTIVNAGTIEASGGAGGTGGNGGNGGNGHVNGGSGSGGGGAGGSGGIGGSGGNLLLLYKSLTNSGTIQAAAGAAGAAGTKGLKGSVGASLGTDGEDGTVGTVGSTGLLTQLTI